MKPFRRVRPGRFLPASRIDHDTGRQVEKALERQPLMPMRLMGSKPILRFEFRCKRSLPITFNHDRILKGLETCLPVSLPLLHSSIIKKLGMGKVSAPLDRTIPFFLYLVAHHKNIAIFPRAPEPIASPEPNMVQGKPSRRLSSIVIFWGYTINCQNDPFATR